MKNEVLIAKLNAISKYTAALSKELQDINRRTCPNCGQFLDITKLLADGLVFKLEECQCGFKNEEGNIK
jgi:predicted  nucleic acid-binding Zn ribbon protein